MRMPCFNNLLEVPCYVKLCQSKEYNSLEVSPCSLFSQLEFLADF